MEAEFNKYKQQYIDMLEHAGRKRPQYQPGFIKVEQDRGMLVMTGAMMTAAVAALLDEFSGERPGTETEQKLLLEALGDHFKVPPRDMYEAVIALRSYELCVLQVLEAGMIEGMTVTGYKLAVTIMSGVAGLMADKVHADAPAAPDLSSVDMSKFDGIVATFKEKNNGRPH